jgi:predicted acylesterase/phospholipase RssA
VVRSSLEPLADAFRDSLDHVGVVKALLDADVLPRVIAGTSAGGLIAALTCTRSDEELKLLLSPKLADNMYVPIAYLN